MSRRGAAGWLWAWLLAAFVVLIAVAFFHRHGMRQLSTSGNFRMGMQESPPWFFLRPDESVDGPVHEIFQEAARRRGLHLNWVADPLGPEHALDKGIADIWPLTGRLPSRLDKYSVSPSWLDLSYVLCSPVDCSAPSPVRAVPPASIAHRGLSITKAILAEHFPAVREIPVASHREALAAVCSGKAGAALISESAQPGGFLNVPAECRESNVCLKIAPVKTVGFGISSRPGSPEALAASIVLRAEIDRMIDDGTLSGILLKWGVSSAEIRALRSAKIAQRHERVMTGIACVFICALIILWIVYRRLLAAKQLGERVRADLVESQAALHAEFDRRRDIETRYHESQKLESLGRLAGGVAHDFNNILSVINGYAEVLLAGLPADDNRSKAVVEIAKAGSRGADLTRQLLIYSRHQDIELTPISINDVINDMKSLLQSMVGSGVSINVKLENALGLALVDRGQINRVLMNLVVNARDALPEGGSITIETSNVQFDTADHTGAFVRVCVSDTGLGMDQGTMSRIFEPFFTTKRPGIGTGMGLPIVQSVAHSFGGWVDVESAPGKGSSFKVFLPLANGQQPSIG